MAASTMRAEPSSRCDVGSSSINSWGDGASAPEWGDAEATAESAKKLVETAKKL